MSLWASYQWLCRRLAPAPTAAERAALQWQLRRGEVKWEQVVRLASLHYVTPALYGALARQDLLDDLPADLRDYLEVIHALTGERNRALRREALDVLGHLNAIGVEPILLKGIAALLTDLYGDPAARVMMDMDLMVPAERLPEISAVLRSAGFLNLGEDRHHREQHQHATPLYHPEGILVVELHHEINPPRLHGYLPAKGAWRDSTPFVVDGRRARLPDPETRVLHNFIHTQLADYNHLYGRVELRQLYEFARLRECYGDRIAWPALFNRAQEGGYSRAFNAYLLAAEQWLGQPLPPGARASASVRLALRRWRLQAAYPAVAVAGVACLYFGLRCRHRFSPAQIRRDMHPSIPRGYWRQLQETGLKVSNRDWHRQQWRRIMAKTNW